MAWFLNWVRRTAPINDPDDLPANLTEADKGRGWLVNGIWYIWTGDYYEWRPATGLWEQ